MEVSARNLADLVFSSGEIVVATLVDVEADGTPIVCIPGRVEPVRARTTVQVCSAAASADELKGSEVVAVIRDESPPDVIIVGIIGPTIWSDENSDFTGSFSGQAAPRSLTLKAKDEIELTCGKSSVVLRSDGSIVVRGVDVISRAKRSNKIRGASVNIN